ncbi:hypothetical protein [Kineococcus arenarius]|uniref:hypothetical protein n=1 Tax=Kineococcus sp. SYSU DK007 TaxID=3383128 RepID=UPI003D7E44DF
MSALSGGAPVLAGTPVPTSTATATSTQEVSIDPDLVTPGLGGFLTLFALAMALYFLGRGMARRVQRVNQRARLDAEERAEAAAARTSGDAGQPDGRREG